MLRFPSAMPTSRAAGEMGRPRPRPSLPGRPSAPEGGTPASRGRAPRIRTSSVTVLRRIGRVRTGALTVEAAEPVVVRSEEGDALLGAPARDPRRDLLQLR